MNNYIFITMTICGISGGTQYIYNKIKYLKKCGYNVFVFSSFSREVLIEDLAEFKDSIIPCLMYSPDMFSDLEISKTLKQIIDKVNCVNSTYIIESNSIDCAKWGELLAKELQCPNLFLNIQEVHNYSQQEIEFLKHLVCQKSLYGITETSVSTMIGTKDGIGYNSAFSAYCTNVVQDCTDYVSENIPKADITISSIGRLEKQCVFPILESIKRYAYENVEKKIAVVLVGGTDCRKVIKGINKLFLHVENVNIYITGFLYPIPKNLFANIDLFISTAGSANVSYWENRPTILVHPISGDPVGILGSDINFNTDMFAEKSYEKTETLIKRILDESIPITYVDSPYSENNLKMEKEFARQLLFAGNNRRYYDARNVKKVKTIKYKFYSFLGKNLGGSLMQKLLESTRKFMK